MNRTDEKYTKYALVREMLETPGIIRSFDPSGAGIFVKEVISRRGLFLTGEGSSRIFPAKRAIAASLKYGSPLAVFTEGGTQAEEYQLDDYAVFAASNSGQTKEVIRLVTKLRKNNHNCVFGLTANLNTRLEDLAVMTHVLKCGRENAVAATKSVIEQALFYDSLLRLLRKENMDGLSELAAQTESALTARIDKDFVKIISSADIIYFSGRNNGVAEELALKTNEITRKKSAFLEGTFAVHGIEEVMKSNEVLIWIDPFNEEIEKFRECLVDGVGMNIIAVSTSQTIFPTILIPDGGEFAEYVQLATGWNILVETGIALGIDLDKPERARKVGNEYFES